MRTYFAFYLMRNTRDDDDASRKLDKYVVLQTSNIYQHLTNIQ